MARKHGFRGTPTKPSKTMSSVGGIFERRGDPMVSDKEGKTKFGRNLETENPDYDRYFAQIATDLLKPSQIDKGNAFRKRNAKPYDPQREAANIMQVMRKKMRQSEPIEVQSVKSESFIPCPYHCGFTAHDSRKVKQHLQDTMRKRDNNNKIKCVPKVPM